MQGIRYRGVLIIVCALALSACGHSSTPSNDSAPGNGSGAAADIDLSCDNASYPSAQWTACEAQHYRSEEHTSELQSLMRISYAVFCLKKKNKRNKRT